MCNECWIKNEEYQNNNNMETKKRWIKIKKERPKICRYFITFC